MVLVLCSFVFSSLHHVELHEEKLPGAEPLAACMQRVAEPMARGITGLLKGK